MATQWKKKQALFCCIAKGTIAHKASSLTPITSIAQETLDVSPQKVAESTSVYATAFSVQRKVYYDGSLFRAFLHDGANVVYYKSSDGITWILDGTLWGYWYSRCGGTDIIVDGSSIYATTLRYYWVSGSDYGYCVYFRSGTKNTSISWSSAVQIDKKSDFNVGGGMVKTSTGRLIIAWEAYYYVSSLRYSYSDDNGASWTTDDIASAVDVSDVLGGVALALMSSGKCVCFVKDANLNLTCYIYDGSSWGSVIAVASGLKDGWGNYAVTSVGDVLHVVYVDSSDNLKYQKYDGSWASAVTLATLASHPVIVVGGSGRLYVFYVKDGKIKLLKFNGVSWGSEATLFPEHTYNNPAYLSSNQNVQNGQICLVWTEGTSTPYGIWFSTIGD